MVEKKSLRYIGYIGAIPDCMQEEGKVEEGGDREERRGHYEKVHKKEGVWKRERVKWGINVEVDLWQWEGMEKLPREQEEERQEECANKPTSN